MSPASVAARILIKGRVQGVGYRFFAERAGQLLALAGWVRNLPDGSVECEVEGPRAQVEQLVRELRQGPSMARVEDVDVQWRAARGEFSGFEIR
jgi:acylphosphatase